MSRPVTRRTQPTADLERGDTSSRGLPADWEILRDGTLVGGVSCPDAETADILATYRYGVGVTVRRKGAAS